MTELLWYDLTDLLATMHTRCIAHLKEGVATLSQAVLLTARGACMPPNLRHPTFKPDTGMESEPLGIRRTLRGTYTLSSPCLSKYSFLESWTTKKTNKALESAVPESTVNKPPECFLVPPRAYGKGSFVRSLLLWWSGFRTGERRELL